VELSALIRTEAVDSLLALIYQNLFEKTFAARMRGAIDAHVAESFIGRKPTSK